MLPHDQQKKARFLTSPTTPNMTIFASKDLPDENIYDESLAGTRFKLNFLSLSDSKKVCMGITIIKTIKISMIATSNNP
jgi:hypothetical protein